jgi:hypothetical protein
MLLRQETFTHTTRTTWLYFSKLQCLCYQTKYCNYLHAGLSYHICIVHLTCIYTVHVLHAHTHYVCVYRLRILFMPNASRYQ